MSDRPNIFLIMTDQQRGDCLSIDGHPALLTPNMDAIGAAGVRFRRAYTTCPSCIAARRSLLSGQFPATHGMVGYRDGVEWAPHPPTVASELRAAGYQTVWIGRTMHQHPDRKRYGFDHMVISGWESDYNQWLDRLAPAGGGYYGTGVMHNDWTARPWHLAEELHHTNWVVSEALRFLEAGRDPSCPLFLVVSFVAPHPPLIPPAFYFERYLRTELPPPDIGDWATPPPARGLGLDVSDEHVDLRGEQLRCTRAGYYGLINHVDDQIRRLLNPVKGIDRMLGGNNVVLFTSDHGEMLGDHYQWRKSKAYEGSARIPLLIRAPQRLGLRRGAVVDTPVCLEDVMPTLLDLAGAPIPATVEGRSLLPLWRGETPAWREHLHLEHSPYFQALLDGREKYIWQVRDGREQLFDLQADPRELHDLAPDPAAAPRVAAWRERLVEQLKARPEGFVRDGKLVAGRPYGPVLPHALPPPA